MAVPRVLEGVRCSCLKARKSHPQRTSIRRSTLQPPRTAVLLLYYKVSSLRYELRSISNRAHLKERPYPALFNLTLLFWISRLVLDARPLAKNRHPNYCSQKPGGLPCSPECSRCLARRTAAPASEFPRPGEFGGEAAARSREFDPSSFRGSSSSSNRRTRRSSATHPSHLSTHCTEFAAAL